MNHVPIANSIWGILAGIALAAIGWAFHAWARRKGKVRMFWMSRVGPAVLFAGVGLVILSIVGLIRGPS